MSSLQGLPRSSYLALLPGPVQGVSTHAPRPVEGRAAGLHGPVGPSEEGGPERKARAAGDQSPGSGAVADPLRVACPHL